MFMNCSWRVHQSFTEAAIPNGLQIHHLVLVVYGWWTKRLFKPFDRNKHSNDPLHLPPLVTGLHLTMFTFQLTVLKPVTSKPGNSELYIVAQGFKGLPDVFLQALLTHIGKWQRTACVYVLWKYRTLAQVYISLFISSTTDLNK